MLLRHLVVGVGLGELARDVRETDDTNNYHPRIAEYFANLDPPIRLVDTDGDGTPNGYAYCAAAVQFVLDWTCRRYGRANPLDSVKREAFVQDYHILAKSSGWVVPADRADVGHLVLYRFGERPTRFNHIGILTTKVVDGTFTAWEANTTPPRNLPDDTGEAERMGDGIWMKPRRITIPELVEFVAWDGNIEVENP